MVKAKIPAGVDTGSRVRLRALGGAGEGGGPAGDLHIETTVRTHRLFKRKGDDLYLDLPVTFTEATLGAKIDVPTIDGTAVMTLPSGTQGGQRFKLSGKGMPSPKTGLRGNQYININIVVPKSVTNKAKEALQEIESLYKENTREGMARIIMVVKDKKQPLYMISVVSEMLHVHPQTLRLYEREGLVHRRGKKDRGSI